MKRMMAGAVLLGLAIAVAGCGSSSGTANATAAAPAGASAGANAPGAPGAADSAAPGGAKASTPVVSAGGTCKYLSDADAAAIIPNAGSAKVNHADTPVSSGTTCLWGTTTASKIYLVGNELKSSAPIDAMKAEMVASITETIPGLGDVGGFATKTAEGVTVVFMKGSTQISIIVSTPSVNADAVVAAAKKIAAGI